MGLSNAERQRRYIERLKAKAARASGATIDDTEVAGLRVDLARANARIAELERQLAAKLRKRGGMSFTVAAEIAKALQPNATAAERHAGLQAFNLFRSEERKAGRR